MLRPFRLSVCLPHSLGGWTVCPRQTGISGAYSFSTRYLFHYKSYAVSIKTRHSNLNKLKKLMSWIEDQGPVLKWDSNSNPNIDLRRRPSIPGELWSWPIHKQKVKVNTEPHWFPRPTPLTVPNGSSIGSAVFAQWCPILVITLYIMPHHSPKKCAACRGQIWTAYDTS